VAWIKTGGATNGLQPLGGFTNLSVAVSGSAYDAPGDAKTERAIPFGPNHTGQVYQVNGSLPASFTNYMFLNTNNAFRMTAPVQFGQKVTLTPKSGLLKTTFTNAADNLKRTASGVVLQDVDAGWGVFLGTNGESGRFLLKGQ
jgi:hypothetical protein